jgi:hypothetical protein
VKYRNSASVLRYSTRAIVGSATALARHGDNRPFAREACTGGEQQRLPRQNDAA